MTFDFKGSAPVTRAQRGSPEKVAGVVDLIVVSPSRSEYLKFTPDRRFDYIVGPAIPSIPLSVNSPGRPFSWAQYILDYSRTRGSPRIRGVTLGYFPS
jgi:hypothetical protein